MFPHSQNTKNQERTSRAGKSNASSARIHSNRSKNIIIIHNNCLLSRRFHFQCHLELGFCLLWSLDHSQPSHPRYNLRMRRQYNFNSHVAWAENKYTCDGKNRPTHEARRALSIVIVIINVYAIHEQQILHSPVWMNTFALSWHSTSAGRP